MLLSPESLVKDSIRLSSLPDMFFKINEIISDPNSSFGDVARVISNDTSLSMRLLKMVNSSFYGFTSRVETISHAVSIVGTSQLRDLALATTILTTFKGAPENIINMNSFWKHSIACGIAARILAIDLRLPNVERFYLAGVLHDVGRLVIFENIPKKAQQIIKQYQEKDQLLYQVEEEVLGFDHTEVGRALIKAWNLPFSIEELISHHHEPFHSEEFRQECAIINMADLLVKSMELGSSGDPYVPPIDKKVWDALGLDAKQLPQLTHQVEVQFQETVELFI